MQQLIGAIIVIMAAAVVIAAIVALTGMALVVAAAVASLVGAYQVVITVRQVIEDRRAAAPVLGKGGEASVAYLFGPVKQDISTFVDNSLKNNFHQAEEARNSMHAAAGDFNKTCWYVWMVLLYVFGWLLTAVTALVSVLIAIPLTIVLATAYALLFVADRISMLLRSLFAVCPRCDNVNFNLYYYCVSCGTRHRHLYVNHMGALYHRCVCGRKLPCHVLTGRGNEDKALCSNEQAGCTQEISRSLINNVPVPIAIIGAASAGKSVFKLAAVHWLRTIYSGKSGRKVDFEDPAQKREVTVMLDNLRKGILPPKTDKIRQRAYTLEVEYTDVKPELVYLYDPPGEAFQNRSFLDAHRFFANLAALVVIVDPFSLNTVTQRLKDQGDWEDARHLVDPSQVSVERVLENVLAVMQRMGARQREDRRYSIAVSVLITKADAFGVSQDIDSYISQPGSGGKDKGIRRWLIENRAGPIVRMIDANFSNVRYFYGSPLHVINGGGLMFNDLMQHLVDQVFHGVTNKNPLRWSLGA